MATSKIQRRTHAQLSSRLNRRRKRQLRFEHLENRFLLAGDLDGDGVMDAVENAGPNSGDGNNDSILDSTQGKVASLPSFVTGNYATLVTNVGTLAGVSAVGNPSPGNAPAGVSFSIGFFDFEVQGVSPVGATATVQILSTDPVNFSSHWLYGPMPASSGANTWSEFTAGFDGRGNASYNGSDVTLSLIDGSAGDNDLTKNGIIVARGGSGGTGAPAIPDDRIILTDVIPATVAGNVAAAGTGTTFSSESTFLGALTEDATTFDFEQASGFPAASAIIGTVDDVDFQGRIGFAVSPPPPSGTQFMRGTGPSAPYDEVGIISFWDIPSFPSAVGFFTGFGGVSIPAPYTRVQIFNQFENMIHEEFIANTGGAGTYFGFASPSQSIGFIELQGMEANLITEADAQQFGIDDLTIGTATLVGDNVNVLPGGTPQLVATGVDATGGPGNNGIMRIHMEWDIANLAGATVQGAEVLLSTLQGSVDSLDTFFFAAMVDGNGTLEVSDFEAFAQQIGGVVMPVTGAPGQAGTFAFNVTSQLQRAIDAGFDYFVLQARVDESLAGQGFERGLQVHSTSTSSPVGQHPQLTVSYREGTDPADDDGVSDAVETGAPNQGDGNNDGKLDSQQSNVASLPNAGNSEYITVESPAGTQLDNVSASLIAPPGAGVELPIGVVSYTLSGLASPVNVVTVIPANPLPAGSSYYKFGKELSLTETDHWYEFLFNDTTGAKFFNAAGGIAGPSDPVVRIELHLTDGLRGDSDLTENGTIVDPGGPTIVNAPPALTVVSGSVTTGIGSVATNTGTFSDAPGQVVSIDSSVGNVGQDDGSSGSWFWQFGPTAGSSDNQTVTITATDNFGAQTVVTFGLTVSDSAPDVLTIDFSPTSPVAEGTLVTVTGTFALGTGPAPFTGSALWSDGVSTPVNVNSPAGTFETQRTIEDTSSNADTPNPGVTVTVTIFDGNLGSDSVTSAPIVAINTAPTIALQGTPNPVDEGATFTLTLGPTTDPDDDTVVAYSVVWGDGTTEDFTGSPVGEELEHTYADGLASHTIRVSLTDEDGTHDAGSFAVDVNNVAPTIALNGAAGTGIGATYQLTLGSVIDPGADMVTAYSVNWGDGPTQNFTRAADGPPDGKALTHIYAGPTRNVTIAVTLTDEDGTFAFTKDITIDEPPVVVVANSPIVVNEGTTALNNGTFSDATPGDNVTITASIGVITQSTGANGTWNWSFGTLDGPVDSQVVVITATDSFGASNSAGFTLTVNNVPPVIDSFGIDPGSNGTFSNKAVEDEVITVLASFSDIGVLDTHTATVSWGDGTTTTGIVTQDSGFGTAISSHAYDTGGIYTITITLTDDDTGVATATTKGVVIGAGIHTINGVKVLEIVGDNNNNLVTINKQGNGLFKIHAGFFPEGSFRTFPTAQVDVIMVFLCGGDDQLNVAGNISTPILADGGSGNDFLKGGDGSDVLIGGTGADDLHGKKGDDALIGGSTQQDGDPAALLEALQAWTANVSYADRVTGIDGTLTVVDDEHTDELKGDQGRDLFYNGLGDDLQDVKNDESTLPVPAAGEGSSADVVELTLAFDAMSFAETGGTTATLTRIAGDLSRSLTVTLASGDSSELQVPATITIPAGSGSITFDLSGINDGSIDDAQVAAIIASGPDVVTAVASLLIDDGNFPYQNAFNALDVNEDGFISPIDALVVINELNQLGARELSDGELLGKIDVSGDNFASAIDALRVINFLTGSLAASAEGEGEQASAAEPTRLSDKTNRQDADVPSGRVGSVITTDLTPTMVRSESVAASSAADNSDLVTPADHRRGGLSATATSSLPTARRVAAQDADELGSELEELAEDLISLHQTTARELLFGRLVE